MPSKTKLKLNMMALLLSGLLFSAKTLADCEKNLLHYNENVLESLAHIDQPPMVSVDGQLRPLHYLRPPQEEALLQIQKLYDDRNEKLNILEVGYGHPSALLALSYFYPQAEITGVETAGPSFDWLSWPFFQASGVKLVTPERSMGKQDLIFAVDVYKSAKEVRFGSPIGQTQAELLKSLKEKIDLLNEGGKLLIINDYAAPLPFEVEQIKSMGAKTLRWGVHHDALLYKYPDIRELFKIRDHFGDKFGIYTIYEFTKVY